MNAPSIQHDDEPNELLDFSELDQAVERTCVLIDRLREHRTELLTSLKEFVTLYDGTRDMLGDSVKAKLERAEAAIAKAEGRHV